MASGSSLMFRGNIDSIRYTGAVAFGKKDAYGKDPGSFYYMMEWVIGGINSDSTDLAYFKSKFISTLISAEYRKVKK